MHQLQLARQKPSLMPFARTQHFRHRPPGRLLMNLLPRFQALRLGQPMDVQEVLQLAPARGLEGLGRWKLQNKIPTAGSRPIVKQLQRLRVILPQGVLQTITQLVHLTDESLLIAGEHLELSCQIIFSR